MNKTITVYYGPDHMTKEVPENFTFGDLKNSDMFRTGLGYGDNINALYNGVAQSDSTSAPPGAQVKIETAANEKATA